MHKIQGVPIYMTILRGSNYDIKYSFLDKNRQNIQ